MPRRATIAGAVEELEGVTAADRTRARYEGDFVAWNGGCLFIGSGGGLIAPHAHYAIQLVVAAPSGLRVQSGRRGAWMPCAGALVASRAVHSIDVTACDWSAVVFVEPETPEGRALSARLAGEIELLEDAALASRIGQLGQAWRVARSPQAVQDAARALTSALSGAASAAPTDPRALQAIETLRACAGDPPTLAELARAAHLSPSRFRHLFVEETGMPLRTYQLWRRLLRAWEFLMQGDSLAAAAHAAGFADSAHLSRTCRTMFGLAPSAMQMSGPLSELRRMPALTAAGRRAP
jgi:AraC-like DNA-binding protein